MDLIRLRSDTRLEHQFTEEAMPLMQTGVTLAQYESVLQRLRSVVTGWETWAQANAPRDLVEMVQVRRRGALIEQDLQSLGNIGVSAPAHFMAENIPGLQLKATSFRAAFLGAMYVVEGSTLGGQHIARHLQDALGMNANHGTAYFRGYGDRTGEMWRAFKAVLTDVPDAESEQVASAAKAMFGVFRMALLG